MIKVPVVNRTDYTMYLEYHQDMLWFHTDIHKWTSAVKKEYLKDLDLLQHLVAVPLVALVNADNIKLAKFGITIGFKFKQPLLGQDKKMYYIYSRSL